MGASADSFAPVPQTERLHVVIVGAGLIGLCSALWLQRAGHRVTIVDRDPPLSGASWRQACSYGNACTVALHGVVPVATPGVAWQVPGMLLDPLGPLAIVWRYLPQLAPWLRAFVGSSSTAEVERIAGVLAGLVRYADMGWSTLIELAGVRELVRHAGCLYLYKSEAQFLAAEPSNTLRESHGVSVERLDAPTIRDIEPRLAPCYHRGVLFRDAYTIVSPKQLALALANAILERGGTFARGEASGISRNDMGVNIRVGEASLQADHIHISGGAWSHLLAREVGDRILLETERGYHVLFPAAGDLLSRPVCYPEHGFYMTPMADGLRAAGTVELGGLAASPTPGRLAMIRRGVELLLPSAGKSADEWLGFRPSMPDSLPVIGRATETRNVTYAFGHGHLGLTFAGITGRLVAELVSERQTTLDLSPFRPDRFTAFGGKRT